MRFAIDHTMRYEYSEPVSIEPLVLRLVPANSIFQQRESFELTADPAPEGIASMIDIWGHEARVLRFDKPCAALTLTVRSVVRTLCENPFDYILTDHGALKLPVSYSSVVMSGLGATLRTRGADCERMTRLLTDIKRGVADNTLDFLFELCSRLARDIKQEIREEGGPRPACQTLAQQTGACRDRAVVFIEACRRVGLAARFVSGYAFDSGGDPCASELHAWAEVFLPGGGWRGYDPSLGLAVADQHITLTASHDPILAAPTSGTFRGTGADSKFSAQVVLNRLD